jgi:hypothetical protein
MHIISACPRALATKQLLSTGSKLHKHCAFRHTTMSILEGIEKLIWEMERRPHLHYKNWKNTVIEYEGDIVVRNLRLSCHELEWASSWTEIRKSTLIFLFILLGIMLININILGGNVNGKVRFYVKWSMEYSLFINQNSEGAFQYASYFWQPVVTFKFQTVKFLLGYGRNTWSDKANALSPTSTNGLDNPSASLGITRGS